MNTRSTYKFNCTFILLATNNQKMKSLKIFLFTTPSKKKQILGNLTKKRTKLYSRKLQIIVERNIKISK